MYGKTFGLGLPTFAQADAWTQKMQEWSATLNGLNQALQIAQAANDASMMGQVKSGIVFILNDINGVKAQAYAADAPSDLLVSMDNFSDRALKLASEAGVAAGSLLNLAPLLLPLAAVVAVVLFGGPLLKGLRP